MEHSPRNIIISTIKQTLINVKGAKSHEIYSATKWKKNWKLITNKSEFINRRKLNNTAQCNAHILTSKLPYTSTLTLTLSLHWEDLSTSQTCLCTGPVRGTRSNHAKTKEINLK